MKRGCAGRVAWTPGHGGLDPSQPDGEGARLAELVLDGPSCAVWSVASSPMGGHEYAEAEASAARFAGRLSDAIGNRVVGVYLVGSFALGDLQPDSDLDFVAVLTDVNRPADEPLIGPLHGDDGDHALEGFYVAAADLRRHPADSASLRLHWLSGEWREVAGALIVECEMLRRFGHRVQGAPVGELGVFDAGADLPAFSKRNLDMYWTPWIERTGPWLMDHGSLRDQAWAATWCVLGVPRLYVAITTGEIVSKTEAGLRARETFDRKWRTVIEAALDHRRRNDDESAARVAALGVDALAFSSHVARTAASHAPRQHPAPQFPGEQRVAAGRSRTTDAPEPGGVALEGVRTRLSGTVIGCGDAWELAEFYASLLGWEVVDRSERDPGGWALVRSPTRENKLEFQREEPFVPPVWPTVAGQQQMGMHLDIGVDGLAPLSDMERRRRQFFEVVDYAKSLGARVADAEPQPDRVVVMLDPAGHPFCLFPGG